MTGNDAIRTCHPLVGIARVAMLILLVSSCDAGDFLHPPAPSTAAMLFAYAPNVVGSRAGSAAVPDRVRILVSRASAVVHDSTYMIPAVTGEVRLRVELELQSETEVFDVVVELLDDTRVISRSSQSVPLTRGELTTASLTPDPVDDNLAVGDGHACYIDPTGQAFCWGLNHVGQLGTGSLIGSSRPVAVQTALRFAAIDAATYHTCALTFDGQAWCWGSNAIGQLGDGTKLNRSTPVPVSGGLRFTTITTGVQHGCGLTTAGELYCWGGNSAGQLGNASLTESPSPQQIQIGAGAFESVSSGFWNVCGRASGTTYCWGTEIGGGFAVRNVPSAAPAGTADFGTIAPGTIHNCALTQAGSAYCWGLAGSLGNGQTSASATPTPVTGGHAFTSIAVSRANSFYAGTTCALTADGRAFCWGFNHAGQLGAPSTESCLATYGITLPCSSVPVSVTGNLRFNTIRTGGSAALQERSGATCGLVDAGTPYCWGDNETGVLGQGDAIPRSVPTRVRPSSAAPVLTTIVLDPESLTLAAGDSTNVTGRGVDQSGFFVPMTFAWTSSDTTRLAIRLAPQGRASTARIVALAAGAVTLTASAEGISASLPVIVN